MHEDRGAGGTSAVPGGVSQGSARAPGERAGSKDVRFPRSVIRSASEPEARSLSSSPSRAGSAPRARPGHSGRLSLRDRAEKSRPRGGHGASRRSQQARRRDRLLGPGPATAPVRPAAGEQVTVPTTDHTPGGRTHHCASEVLTPTPRTARPASLRRSSAGRPRPGPGEWGPSCARHAGGQRASALSSTDSDTTRCSCTNLAESLLSWEVCVHRLTRPPAAAADSSLRPSCGPL